MKRCLLLILVLAAALPFDNVTAQDPPKIALTDDEQNIVDLANQERKKLNLAPLKVNAVLCRVARAHSANMAKQGKMEHVLDGKTQFERIKGAAYKYSLAGENLARGDVPPDEVMQAWMKSKSHRDNILEAEFVETGVGIAKDDKEKVYYTQIFATPRE